MAKLHPQWPPGSSHFFRNKKSFFSFTFPQFPAGFQYGTPHTTFVFWGHSICCVLSSKSLAVFFCKLAWVQWWLTFGLLLKLRFRRKRDARKDFWFWDLRKFQAMWMFGVKPTDGKRWVKMCFFCILWFHERKLPKFSKDENSYKTIVGHFFIHVFVWLRSFSLWFCCLSFWNPAVGSWSNFRFCFDSVLVILMIGVVSQGKALFEAWYEV